MVAESDGANAEGRAGEMQLARGSIWFDAGWRWDEANGTWAKAGFATERLRQARDFIRQLAPSANVRFTSELEDGARPRLPGGTSRTDQRGIGLDGEDLVGRNLVGSSFAEQTELTVTISRNGDTESFVIKPDFLVFKGLDPATRRPVFEYVEVKSSVNGTSGLSDLTPNQTIFVEAFLASLDPASGVTLGMQASGTGWTRFLSANRAVSGNSVLIDTVDLRSVAFR